MEDNDKIRQRFELLKMARELLNEDYINRRAEDHNKWVAENDESWRTKRRNVPYPPFAQYPTDEEIVRAAANLYNFIYDTDNKPVHTVISAEVVNEQPAVKGFEQGDDVFPPVAEIIEPTVVENIPEVKIEPVVVKEEALVEEEKAPPTLAEIKELSAVVASKKFLPGWIRRTIE